MILAAEQPVRTSEGARVLHLLGRSVCGPLNDHSLYVISARFFFYEAMDSGMSGGIFSLDNYGSHICADSPAASRLSRLWDDPPFSVGKPYPCEND